jgi:hypothetical protein
MQPLAKPQERTQPPSQLPSGSQLAPSSLPVSFTDYVRELCEAANAGRAAQALPPLPIAMNADLTGPRATPVSSSSPIQSFAHHHSLLQQALSQQQRQQQQQQQQPAAPLPHPLPTHEMSTLAANTNTNNAFAVAVSERMQSAHNVDANHLQDDDMDGEESGDSVKNEDIYSLDKDTAGSGASVPSISADDGKLVCQVTPDSQM